MSANKSQREYIEELAKAYTESGTKNERYCSRKYLLYSGRVARHMVRGVLARN